MHGTLDLRRLRYFLAIAEHGSLTAAARVLNVAQPALSYHVAELERLCELTLVLRGRDGIRLTAEGEVLRRHAAEIVARADEAERALERLARGPRPQRNVRLAIITSLAADLTPLLVERVARTEQAPKLSILEAGTRDIETRLAQSRVDLAVSLSPSPATDAVPIASEELHLVAPPGTVPGPAVTLADVARQRFVLPGPGNPLRDFIDETARRNGISPDIVLEVDGPASRFNAVVSGIGCTFLGARSIPASAPEHGLCVLPVTPPLRRPIYLGRRRGLDADLADLMRGVIASALGDLGLEAVASGIPAADMVR
ncbi:LysR family transcriptional regulator [Rhodobacterales bacterium HKCCE2091]|nr:LysR family transcriptional regulator [Rhodobacterales bacterium HKCCE2091]